MHRCFFWSPGYTENLEISCVDDKDLYKVVPRAFMDYVLWLKNPLTKCPSLWNILDRQEINWAWRWLSFPKQPYKVRVVATIEMATRHSTTRSLLLTRWTPLWNSHLKDDKISILLKPYFLVRPELWAKLLGMCTTTCPCHNL